MGGARNPERQEPALKPVVDVLESTFSRNALQEIQPVLSRFRSVSRQGDRVTLTRAEASPVPLSGELLNGNIKLTSVDIGKDVSFEIDQKTRTASNISGISINLTVFDEPFSLPVTRARLGFEGSQKFLFTEIKNPLPEPAWRITGMQPTVTVAFPVGSDGLRSPHMSKVFADAASSTNKSLPGLLAADALTEASKVSLFVESNPRWVSHVVEPAVHNIYRNVITSREQAPKPQQASVYGDTRTNPYRPVATQPTVTDILMQSPLDRGGDANALAAKRGDHARSIEVEGVMRNYKVHVPPGYDGKTPMPVVILLHGHGQDGDEIARHTKLTNVADRRGFIAVYPDARSWAGRSEWRAWDTDNGLIPPGANANDVAFLRKIIETTEKDYVVDDKRIFMAGLSNGGMMSFRAVGELSDKLAAIAVVSGAMSGSEPSLQHPVSLLNIHGTDDGIVPYEGLKNVPESLSAIGLPKFKSTQYATEQWVQQNKIASRPVVSTERNVTQRRFIDPKSGVEVNEYTIHGGRHVPDDITKVVEKICDFFEAHPKTQGETSKAPQPAGEQPFNLTERLRAHVRNRGLKGLELDAGATLNEVRHLPDGSFSPSRLISQFEGNAGIQLEDGISKFLKSTDEIKKQKDRITLDFANPQKVEINSGARGPIALTSVNIDDTSFDLLNEGGQPALKNIKGVTFGLRALGRDLNIGLNEVSQKLDGAGSPYYQLKTENPMSRAGRIFMLARSEVPIELRLDQSGKPVILNERQIKDAALGVNPVARGYFDIGNHAASFAGSPSWRDGLHLAKDLGVFGGTGYGAYRVAALKFGTRGKVGAAIAATAILAPAIIHGIERIID